MKQIEIQIYQNNLDQAHKVNYNEVEDLIGTMYMIVYEGGTFLCVNVRTPQLNTLWTYTNQDDV